MTRLSATARKVAASRRAGSGLPTSSLRSLQGEGMPGTSAPCIFPKGEARGCGGMIGGSGGWQFLFRFTVASASPQGGAVVVFVGARGCYAKKRR